MKFLILILISGCASNQYAKQIDELEVRERAQAKELDKLEAQMHTLRQDVRSR